MKGCETSRPANTSKTSTSSARPPAGDGSIAALAGKPKLCQLSTGREVTDAGIAKLKGLDGLFVLTFFWHSPHYTSAGLAALAACV
jgi:hypothetical protein